MKRIPLTLFASVSWLIAASAQAQSMLTGEVVGVTDGDHVQVMVDGVTQEFNLAYIRPPSDGSWPELATEQLSQLLPVGTPVQLDIAGSYGGGQYAYIYTSNGFVNAQMLQLGASLPFLESPNAVVQSAYQQAVMSGQVTGAGVYAASTTASVALDPASTGGWNWDPQALLQSEALKIGSGIGVAAVVGLVLLKKLKSRKPRTVKTTTPARELKNLQKSLSHTLVSQKKLEQQVLQATQQAENWLNRAKVALTNQNEDLAREALVRKNTHLQEAERLKQSLDEVNTQVSGIRATMQQLQTQQLTVLED